MQYFDPEGMKEATGLAQPKDWYPFVIKELLDNAVDWLQENYKGSENATVTATFTISEDGKRLNYKVRNTNPDNIPVLKDKHLLNIFDYAMTYGSKQNEFKISRGTLGDAMKYVAALPYILVNLGRDRSNDFEDQQWPIPMYIRHNGIEQELLLVVDEANSTLDPEITPSDKAVQISHTDTEIEVNYPLIDEVIPQQEGYSSESYLEIDKIKDYCLDHIVGTTDISFEIKITDNLGKESSPIQINQPRTHAISDDWNNLPSILAYTPQEFRKKIFGVDDKSLTIYQVLRTFKQGTQLKKTPDLDVPISTLVKDSEKVKELYFMLRNSRLGKKPPRKISLPYSKVTASSKSGVEE